MSNQPDAPASKSEAQTQAEILNEFGSRPSIKLWRINVLAARQGQRFIKSAPKGHSDLAGIIAPTGRALYIEVKSPTGRASKEQKQFGAMILKMGGIWILARSIADVEAALASETK